MNTFILFWNPDISNYKLEDLYNALQKDCHVDNWAVWDYNEAHRGDRFFWVRCGKGNTGICMSGYFRSEPYVDEDWSGKGRCVHYVKLIADTIIDPEYCPILTTEDLQRLIPDFNWTGGHSGQLLSPSNAQKLETRWIQFLEENKTIFEKHSMHDDFDINEIDWSLYDEYDGSEDDEYDLAEDEMEAQVTLTTNGMFRIDDFWQDDDGFNVCGIDLTESKAIFERHIAKNGIYDKIRYSYNVTSDNALFEKAALLACEMHRGQVDKAGKPYISHLIRVASRCSEGDSSIVAMLHDIIEDTEITVDILNKEGFPKKIVNAVNAITRREGEDYEIYIQRVGRNKLARIVKIYDLEDNMDIRRLTELTPTDIERIIKYLRAWHYLDEIR